MNALWSYFWPVFAAGVVLGAIAAAIALRRQRQLALVAGAAVAIAAAAIWHGPLGAADHFSNRVERIARHVLADYEAPRGVTARMHHGPLTRELILSGPADEFQRAEAARLLNQIPGVSDAVWGPTGGIPLIVESWLMTVIGFLVGWLLAYLVELRRRYNSQWKW